MIEYLNLKRMTAMHADEITQAVTGVVLTAYFGKSKAENTRGGIVYDAALGVSNSDTDL